MNPYEFEPPPRRRGEGQPFGKDHLSTDEFLEAIRRETGHAHIPDARYLLPPARLPPGIEQELLGPDPPPRRRFTVPKSAIILASIAFVSLVPTIVALVAPRASTSAPVALNASSAPRVIGDSPGGARSIGSVGNVVDGTSRGIVKEARTEEVTGIILHDTEGPTAEGAISTLLKRGLGYHYLVDRDERGNSIIMLVDPTYLTHHAKAANIGTIGISFVGGHQHGTITEGQQRAAQGLVLELKKQFPKISYISGHKHVYINGTKSGKQDPEIDVGQFAQAVGLEFRSKVGT